jgi:hypothetical protein
LGVLLEWELFVAPRRGGSVANALQKARRSKKPAAGFPAAGFCKSISCKSISCKSIIVLRRHPSLADLAATYSSKP